MGKCLLIVFCVIFLVGCFEKPPEEKGQKILIFPETYHQFEEIRFVRYLKEQEKSALWEKLLTKDPEFLQIWKDVRSTLDNYPAFPNDQNNKMKIRELKQRLGLLGTNISYSG